MTSSASGLEETSARVESADSGGVSGKEGGGVDGGSRAAGGSD